MGNTDEVGNDYDDIHLKDMAVPEKITVTDYDPDTHRKKHKPSGVVATYLNMVKATFGTGMLSMPMAFKNMGIYSGTFIILFIGSLIMWCAACLIRNIRKICIGTKNAEITYPHAMRISLEKGPSWLKKTALFAPITVNTLNILCQFLTLASYILFMANVTKQITDFYSVIDIRLHVVFLMIPLLILNCFLRDLRLLAYFSLFGNAMQMVGVLISFYYMIGGEYKNPDELVKFAPWHEILLGFGTTVYSFTSAGVLVSLEFNMKQPSWFLKPCGVLNSGVLFTIGIYISMGILAYAKFGDNIAGTYIRNLPNEFLASTAVVTFGTAVFTGFFIHIYPILEIITRWYMKRNSKENLDQTSRKIIILDIGTRFLLIIFGGLLVIVFNEIHLLVGLIGSLCMCTLNIVFPCVMEYCMACFEEPHNNRRKIVAGLLGIISFTLCVMGVLKSAIDMGINAFT